MIYAYASGAKVPTFEPFLLRLEADPRVDTHVVASSHVPMFTAPNETFEILANVRTGRKRVLPFDTRALGAAPSRRAHREPFLGVVRLADRPVRDSYYSGLSDELDMNLAMGGIGWHYDTGLQLLRLVLSGTFDRFPELQVIDGHWGEVVLFYLERIDILSSSAQKLKKPVVNYFRSNVYITPSGIFSQRYLRWAIDVVGVNRILFSTDYPYVYQDENWARAFLYGSPLTADDRNKIAHGNWDRLCERQS